MQHDLEIRRFAHFVRGSADELGSVREQPVTYVYRRLVRERTISAMEATLPRTTQLIGRERLATWVEDFLAERGSRSPYFRDVSGEIVRWCLSRGMFDRGIPKFCSDAARFELTCFEVNLIAPDPPRAPFPLALDLPVQLSPASVLLACEHAVHRARGFETPAAERVDLLIYRDSHSKRVLHLELTEAAAQVLKRLRAGATLEVGIKAGLSDAAVPCDDVILGEVSVLLADLAQRGILLGAANQAS